VQELLAESKNSAPLQERHWVVKAPEQVLQEELQLIHYLVGLVDIY